MAILFFLVLTSGLASAADAPLCKSGKLLAKAEYGGKVRAYICEGYYTYFVEPDGIARMIDEPSPSQKGIEITKSGGDTIEYIEKLFLPKKTFKPLFKTTIRCKESCSKESTCAFKKLAPIASPDPMEKYFKDGKFTGKYFVGIEDLLHKEYVAALEGNARAIDIFLRFDTSNSHSAFGASGSAEFDEYRNTIEDMKKNGCL